MRPGWLAVPVLALLLAGCASEEEQIDDAIAQARAQCEAQHKQFTLKERPKIEHGELFDHDIEVDASCVGPDDPGYQPPKS